MTVSRTRMSPEARRRQFIDLGVQMAREQPLDTVTIEAVADAAGVSKGLLFHYFESKADFHLAVVREQAQEMIDRTAPREDLTDPIEMLQASVTAYVDYVTDIGQGFIGVIRGSGNSIAGIRDVAESTRQVMSERILTHTPALGIERTPAIELAVAGWIAYVEEMLVRWLADPVVDRETLIAMFVTALPALAGISDALTDA
ncbi:MAG: TetR/AcrR family transcriptional regulator [Gordonia sp. (in: high G+C Gram-positive bacteria)]|jgi:AcrR family transcriptional regulator|nr:TetR/AcrR family transcriptional regulator [Gordonia sp. (in: high G+C Gram-positive bacteria)]